MPASFIKAAHSFQKLATADIPFVFPSSGASWQIAATGRRAGQNSLKCVGGTTPLETLAGATLKYHMITFAVKPTNWDTQYLCGVKEAGTQHVGITLDTGGVLCARRGSTLLVSSGVVLPKNDYTQIQALFGVDDASGIVQVRLNGDTTPIINFTGDTRNGGSAGGDRATLDASANREWCDYIHQASNTQGDLTWYHDAAVTNIEPISNDTVNGTPSSGSNYAAVADVSQATYVDMTSAVAPNNFDLYNLADLPAAVTTVYAVLLRYIARKEPAGGTLTQSSGLLNQAGTPYQGSTTFTQGGTLAGCEEVWPTQPAGGAWSAAAVNALKAGFIRTT